LHTQPTDKQHVFEVYLAIANAEGQDLQGFCLSVLFEQAEFKHFAIVLGLMGAGTGHMIGRDGETSLTTRMRG
jgi:hypothetical protein